MMLRYLLPLVGIVGCGDAPYPTAIALRLGPGDLSPAKTLTIRAALNGKASSETFKIVSGPLTSPGIRLPAEDKGLLHLDITAEDASACVVWRGALDREVPDSELVPLTLQAVQPPECP